MPAGVARTGSSLVEPQQGIIQMKYGILWLLGVPLPILIIGYLIFH